MAEAPERPAELDPLVPFPPMEAELVRELPLGDGWAYEPKWDGFRGVLENAGGELRLWSRNGRPLLRYFPELRPLGELLPPRSAIDGEIVIDIDGAIDFDAMQTRLHPAESRIRRLSGEIPARFVGFDVLVWEGAAGVAAAVRRAARRARARCGARSTSRRRSPIPTTATAWLEELELLGLDGVVAKRLDLPVEPGGRGAVVKVKPDRTADCVVVGRALEVEARQDRDAAARPLRRRRRDRLRRLGGRRRGRHDAIAEQVLPLLDEASDRRFSEPNRWGGQRARGAAAAARARRRGALRQGAGAAASGTARSCLRFRPDKDPASCTWAELRPPREPGGLDGGGAARR